MNPRVFHNGKVQLYAGNCIEILRELTDNSIDAVVTDPPYHLTANKKGGSGVASVNLNNPYGRSRIGTGNGAGGFMGKAWDGGDIAFRPELWAEVLRVLKPGGHMVCFGGTRTYHRMTCAIEDAGLEIRDAIMWHYGSGFPKSHDVSKGIDRALGAEREIVGRSPFDARKPNGSAGINSVGSSARSGGGFITAPATDAARQWQGYGTALKPATEIICLARKPLSESTVAANVLRWGTGALNIDKCRVGETVETWPKSRSFASGISSGYTEGLAKGATQETGGAPNGRWPANLCHDGSPEVLAGFPETDGVVGALHDPNGSLGYHGGACGAYRTGTPDFGSAARFFASFPQEKNQCQSLNGHASYAESSFILSSEAVVSVLSHAVEASTLRLALHQQSYRALATNVSGQLLDEIETLLTGAILNIEKRFLRGLLPEKHFLSNSHANIAATPKPTGTTTITISLLTSNGPAEVATFDLIEMNSEAGASASAKRFHYTSKANADDRLNSKHPTVKPVDLMQWLVRLVCPKGATVLDPFAGTGTTGAAAFIEGRRCVLIEREAEYLADIEKRMEMLLSGPDERARKLAKPESLEALPLFALTKPAA